MKIGAVISIIILVVVLAVVAFFYFNNSPSIERPSNQACGAEFKLLECNYDDMIANVNIKLVNGEIEGFNGRLKSENPSERLYGIINEINRLNIKQGETKNFEFNFNITTKNIKGPFMMEIDPILSSSGEVCLSGASIPCK